MVDCWSLLRCLPFLDEQKPKHEAKRRPIASLHKLLAVPSSIEQQNLVSRFSICLPGKKQPRERALVLGKILVGKGEESKKTVSKFELCLDWTARAYGFKLIGKVTIIESLIKIPLTISALFSFLFFYFFLSLRNHVLKKRSS